MPELIVKTEDGARHVVNGEVGMSVMEAIREHGIEELLAICGGCCSCATCHVYVDPSFSTHFPLMGDDERALLDRSGRRTQTSRLSCQLPIVPALQGAQFIIARDS